MKKFNITLIAVEHAHGTNYYAGFTEEDAYAQLVEYVQDNWADELDRPIPEGLPDDELVDQYFAEVEYESYVTEEVEVCGMVPEALCDMKNTNKVEEGAHG